MITEDFKVAEDIFSLLNEGIVDDFDSFVFTAEVHSNYMETEFLVTSNGTETDNPKTNYNGAVLYKLIRDLKEIFSGRGENWESFTMSYNKGGQVKTQFCYPQK